MDQGICQRLFLGFALCRGRQTNEREDRAHAARSEEGREVGRRSPDADGRTVAPRVRVLALQVVRPSATERTLERDKNSVFSGGLKKLVNDEPSIVTFNWWHARPSLSF